MSAARPPVFRSRPVAKAVRLAALSATSLTLLAGPGLAQDHGRPAGGAPPAGVALSDSGRVRRLREDLRFITERVRRQHPRPFALDRAAAFDSAERAIEAAIPERDDAGLAVECMRMVAGL